MATQKKTGTTKVESKTTKKSTQKKTESNLLSPKSGTKKSSNVAQKQSKTKKGQTSKQTKNQNTKGKYSPFLLSLALIFLVFGVGGFFTFNLLTKNDEFSLVGEKEITLNVGDEYVEQGTKVISFGKDKSSQVVIESNVDTSVAGEYYVKYTIKDFRFKDVVRYRYVKVVEA